MTNREWINSLSDEEFAKWLNKNANCTVCVNHVDGEESCLTSDCVGGICRWLRAKHEEPMPEIKAGDLLFYGKESYYVAIAPDKLVTLRGYVVVDLENAIRNNSIISVRRYMNGEVTTIWRADNGN